MPAVASLFVCLWIVAGPGFPLVTGLCGEGGERAASPYRLRRKGNDADKDRWKGGRDEQMSDTSAPARDDTPVT